MEGPLRGCLAGAAAWPQTSNTSTTLAQIGNPMGSGGGTIDLTGGGNGALKVAAQHTAAFNTKVKLVLRSDGHYPPLHAGEHKGIDNDTEVFRRWPFIFWEPGRFIADVFKSLLTTPDEIARRGRADTPSRQRALSSAGGGGTPESRHARRRPTEQSPGR